MSFTNLDIDVPTLLSPTGGEKFTHETIQISWEEPLSFASQSSGLYWYEILFSVDTTVEDNRNWTTISTVPVGNSTFNWKISSKVRSDKCRIGIRSISYEGNRSSIIMSSNVFSVQNKILSSPAIFSPLDGDKFFTYIPIVFDQGGLSGQFPKRAHYRISYSSSSQEIDWIIIKDNISITTSTTYLDVSSFVSSDDYSFKFELIDGENSSQPVFVNNITVNNLSFFKIDTVPPTGLISVRNNSEYINNRDIILELTSYDATSGTESFRIRQKEIDLDLDDTIAPLMPISDIGSWRVVNADGVKLIEASFVDFAGNELSANDSEFFFRTYKSIDNRIITSLLVNKNGSNYDIWMAVGGIDPELFLNGTSVVGAEATGTLNYLPANVNGTSLDYEQRYNIDGLGNIDVVFNAQTVADRFVIEGGGIVLEDTGLMTGEESFNISVAGLTEIIVKVTSETAGTVWDYSLDSKNNYPTNSDFYETADSQDKPAGEVLSMSMYNDVLYLGVKSSEAKGLLQRYAGAHIESVYAITTLDSIINSMVVFDSKLFLACANGELYSFNGTSVTLKNTFESGLHRIGTDGNLLYIFLDNSNDIYTAYKDILGELVYIETTLE